MFLSEWREFPSAPCMCSVYYRGADKSLPRLGRKQANVPVRMAWISFGALPCRKKEIWWQLVSRCCWNRARPWHASKLLSFLVGLRTYQHQYQLRTLTSYVPKISVRKYSDRSKKIQTIALAGRGGIPVQTIFVRLGNAPSVTCSANACVWRKSKLFHTAFSTQAIQ